MVISLVKDFGKFTKVVLKGELRKRVLRLLVFVALVHVLMYFCCCSEGCLC
jgi:hypothetical protein